MINNMTQELEDILENNRIKAVFQPIVSLKDGKVLGHEALSRIVGESLIPNTEKLFELANEYNRLWDLELLCRVKSLEAAYIQMKPPYDKKLFLNVNPRIMHDIKFQNGFTREYLKKYDIKPDNIIFEITERNAIKDMESFQSVVNHYKNQKYQIAIDDAGAGYSGLNLISDIHPHFLKLDMNLIREIDKDKLKYALVKGMIEFSHITDVSLIAEGIETEEELKTLVNLGVQYGQGYFIQRPDALILEIKPNLIQYVKKLNDKRSQRGTLSSVYIDSICKNGECLHPTMMVEEVFDEFQQDSNIYGMCIIHKEKVIGIITRDNLTIRLSGRYGFSLNQKKKITAIMDMQYLEVDYQTPIRTVSYLAMERENKKLYDMIVVTKNGKYFGTVTIKDLLKKATEIDLAKAINQNPLSGLPGNAIIEQELQKTLKLQEYTVMYLDIDNFKAFNDVYGFEKGDYVIKILSKIIICYIGQDSFAGHVGGDDFVVILNHYKWEEVAKSIIKHFEKEALTLYSMKDKNRGGIITANRHGVIEEYPFVSLTVAVLTNQKSKYYKSYELTEELACLKKMGKQKKGSICCCNESIHVKKDLMKQLCQ